MKKETLVANEEKIVANCNACDPAKLYQDNRPNLVSEKRAEAIARFHEANHFGHQVLISIYRSPKAE